MNRSNVFAIVISFFVVVTLLAAERVVAAPADRTIAVVAGTYGANCQKPHGNATADLAQTCNGKTSCAYKVNYSVIGDPAPGCSKDYLAEWKCGTSDAVLSARAAAEAGYGSLVNLTCGDLERVLIESDAGTEFSIDGKHWSPAVLTWNYPEWPTMDGGKWIWTAYLVSPKEARDGSPVITFRRSFAVKASDVGRATLQITADNAYDASFNGQELGTNGPMDAKSSNDQDWRTFDTYDVSLKSGANTLVVRVVNYHSPSGTSDPHSNPGGVIFKLTAAPSLAKTVESGGKAEIYGIHFDVDKADIKPDSKAVLAEIANMMKQTPELKIEISGHTDSTGSPDHNKALSEKRAAAVVSALAREYGIAADRMTAAGYGDTKPVASNDSTEGRTANRRVEIRKLP